MKKYIQLTILGIVLLAATATQAAGFTWIENQPLVRVGSQGQQVFLLQVCMSDLGNNPDSNIDGSFGPITRAAVMSFQAENGLYIDGIIGNQTGPVFTAACSDNIDPDPEDQDDPEEDDFPTTGGDEASLEDFDLDSEDDAEEGEMTHVATIEFDVEDGDVKVKRIDFTFTDQTSGGADDEPWDVYDTITLVVDGDEIAEEDLDDEDDWKEDDDPFEFRISGLNYIVEEGDTAEIEVYLTAANNVDDVDNANWDLHIEDDGIRTIDTAGITSYIGDDTDVVSISMDEEGGGEDIKIRSSNDDPDSSLLLVDEDDDSEWHEVFVFELEAEENDIDLEEIVIVVVTTEIDYDDLVADVKLEIDGEEFDDFDVDVTDPDAAILTFDIDKDFTIDGDESVDVVVLVELQKADQDDDGVADGAYDDLPIETIQIKTVSVEGEGVDDVSDTRSVTGNVHSVTLTDVEIKNISWDTSSSNATGVIDFFFTVDNSDGDEDFKVVAAEVMDIATAAFIDAIAYISLSGEGTLSKVSGDTPITLGFLSYTVGDGDTTGFRVRYYATLAGVYEVTMLSVAGVEIADDDQLSPTLIID